MRHRLLQRLWSEPGLRPWVVLDGAGVPGLPARLSGLPAQRWACLFHGQLEPDVAELAPCLLELPRQGELLDWLLSGWGRHWGVYLLAPEATDLAALRRHLRKLGVVQGPAGEPLWFRWYDPRVLGLAAPGFDSGQLQTLFGPVRRFLLETERPDQGLALELAASGLALSRF
jgi:hypothetical protein